MPDKTIVLKELPTMFDLSYLELTGVVASFVLFCILAFQQFGYGGAFCFMFGAVWTVLSPRVIQIGIEQAGGRRV